MTGVTITDNSGITPTVTITGSLSAVEGSYTITYKAVDEVGNETIKTRIITVASQPNKPQIESPLIPIKYNDTENGWEKITEEDNTWYNYNAKRWANAVILVSNPSKTYNVGDIISENDIAQMYVWIPRYEYENITSTTATEIKIKFIQGIQTITTANYRTHPAFTFGNIETDGVELTGIWVGKFETSHTTLSSSTTNNNLGCTTETCANADGLRIVPNVRPLGYNSISRFFYASRSLSRDGNVFGIDKTKIDTHMMKNTEWGAVAYLSHSKYGINGEIRINNNGNFMTGCGAASETRIDVTSCEIQYGNSTTYPQSTTGDITGIFDMAGGSGEFIMGVQYSTAANTSLSISSSGFTQANLNGLNSKYIDKYAYGTSESDYSRAILGDATKEVRGWHSSTSGSFTLPDAPWFYRGGRYAKNSFPGIFAFTYSTGTANLNYSFRIVLAVP